MPPAFLVHTRLLPSMVLLFWCSLNSTSIAAQAPTPSNSPAEWTQRDIPQSGSAAWRQAATADWSWDLSVGPSGLLVRAIKVPDPVRLGVSGGLLLGSAKGLVWTPANEQAASTNTPLCTEPISALYQHPSGVYALSSSPAGQSSSGKLWQVQQVKGVWQANWIVDLHESAWTIGSAGNRQLWVVTQTRLYKVDLVAKKITTIIDNAFWNGLRPVSMVSHQGLIHIGMRGGVASIDPEYRVIAWTQRLTP